MSKANSNLSWLEQPRALRDMDKEASTSTEQYRRLEKVRENRVVLIFCHVQETHSRHLNRLVKQRRELDQKKPQVKVDQISARLEPDQHQLQMKVLNRDLDQDQQMKDKLHQDLKVVKIPRLNRHNLDQGQAT